MEKSKLRAYALDQLREYLILDCDELQENVDLKKTLDIMKKKGYFFKVNSTEDEKEIERTFEEFANAYKNDKSILEKDLIFFGSRRAIEKMDANRTKKQSVK